MPASSPHRDLFFTLSRPLTAFVAKAQVNQLLGYRPGFTWQGNLLIMEEGGRKLADAVELVLTD
jgi:hypothetical protein